MFPRLTFWPGLLLGALTAFSLRRRWLTSSRAVIPDPLLELFGEGVVVCDSTGVVTYTNAMAKALFGPSAKGVFSLRYPSGQPVPPGQIPLLQACRTRTASEGIRYQCVSPEKTIRWLEVSARPRPDGGATAVFRDITALHESFMREAEVKRQEGVLSVLCRRLSLAEDRDELGQSLVEGALAWMEQWPNPRARLYLYHLPEKQLIRLASAPEERPKRPRSQRQAQTLTFPFDANSPLLWQVYVARQIFICRDVAAEDRFDGSALGEEKSGSACAVPLIASGVTLGHLSLTCSAREAFDKPGWGEALGLAAALAASALTGMSQAAQIERLAGQGKAWQKIVQALTDRQDMDVLADLAAGQVTRVLEGQFCLLAVSDTGGKRLRLAGAAYRDALLFPERHALDAPALIDAAVQEGAGTGKTVVRLGLPNPGLEAGMWRAFAGQSGRHSILAAPLRAGRGVLAVYRSGETAFTPEQVRFVESVAALLSMAMPSATQPAAPIKP